ncbi:hypothetical protein X275_03735 [Marinitoga sp. 1197]|uniref:hypothetical protein n=1 Tax=Marinitoga sp. 1197 TaxID=1428449 RepID=UPI0006412E8B|nr:hypothetical protein [Marinitoga sp. 1197]KLO23266.1 hypothetical protein X275_03735 [Marinitoga sp. 1197]
MGIRMDAIYERNVNGYGHVNQGRYVIKGRYVIIGSETWEKFQQRKAQKIEEFNQEFINMHQY